MRRLLTASLLGFTLLAAVLAARTAQLRSPSFPPVAATGFAPDEAAAARRLGEAVRFPTVSYEEPEPWLPSTSGRIA